jgi:hypothetical protein
MTTDDQALSRHSIDGVTGTLLGRCMRLQAVLAKQPSPITILAYGAVKRSMFLADGFGAMVGAWNIICAGAILRLQIDTALRVHATSLVDDPDGFVAKILTGRRIDKLSDRAGNKLRDRFLVDSAAVEFPWVRQIYNQASGFVHFSDKHLLTGLSPASPWDREILAVDLTTLHDAPEALYEEASDAFVRTVELTITYVDRLLDSAGISA